MGEKKTIKRLNDKMVSINIDIEKLMSNQEVYNLYASLKQQEIQFNQQMRKTEHELDTIRKEIAFLDEIAHDCEKRIPKDDEKH